MQLVDETPIRSVKKKTDWILINSFFLFFFILFVGLFVRSFVNSFIHLSIYFFFLDSDFDECQTNPCQNGGTYKNNDGAYTCKCDAGYGGKQCEAGKYINPSLKQFQATVEILSKLSYFG